MKKSGPIILALLLVLTNLSLFAMPASAANSGDFTYSVISEAKKTCAITGYSGNAAELHIPYKLDGYTVTSINGMDSNDNLKTVWIPNSVTELKAATFWNCQNLECVVRIQKYRSRKLLREPLQSVCQILYLAYGVRRQCNRIVLQFGKYDN